jgi:hypothetical protein
MSFIFYVWKTRWLRYGILLFLGAFIYLAGMGASDEAAQYKDGPQAIDVESLSAANLEYDYLKVTGFTDSQYYYTYQTEEGKEDEVNTDRPIVLFYALWVGDQLDAFMAGEAAKPVAFVRQQLPLEERGCVETEAGCMEMTEATLEGRLLKEITGENDKDTLNKLITEGGYTADENTLYFDANWKPSTASRASNFKTVGLGWLGATVAGLFYSIFKRRKKNAPDEAITRDPNIASIQEHK